MNHVEELFKHAADQGASDIFLIAGLPLSVKTNNQIRRLGERRMPPEDIQALIAQVYALSGRSMERMLESGDDDFSFSLPGVSRFRVSVYRQRGSLAAVVRVVAFSLPDPDKLGIPETVLELGDRAKGLVLVTGPAGSGKSTTLACMIDRINHSHNDHIITLEDPIEFLHRHDKSIISQREIATDTASSAVALRAALRQAPDVILLGEMRDYETMRIAMTAAETGHLLLSTLHTLGAANTIDRIIDVFPASQQHQIAIQLSTTLHAVVSQQLVPTVDNHMVPAFEIMTVTPAIRNMIRENKIPQIEGLLYASARPDMVSMDNSLLNLYHAGRITRDTALTYATNPEMLGKKL